MRIKTINYIFGSSAEAILLNADMATVASWVVYA
jgi:hypothetical protein